VTEKCGIWLRKLHGWRFGNEDRFCTPLSLRNDGNMTKKTIPEPSEKHDVRVLELIVMPKGQPTYSEMATRIEIDDEAGGEYVKLTQYAGHTDLSKSIAIDPDEWPKIRECIDYMISECRTEQE
jgi:hypothetical protein